MPDSFQKYLSERTIIVIPARGGSKRLPRKNCLPIADKPLFYYSVAAARNSLITPHIYVLSDDDEILQHAHSYGAIPFKLPLELARDTTEVVKPSLYALKILKETKELEFDDLICLQPTSPLRTAEDIVKSYLQFKETGANSLVSVSEVDPHFFHWVVDEYEPGYGKLYFGEKFLKSRTELPPVYSPNGAIKIMKINQLFNVRHFFGEKMAIYKMPKERSIHIADGFEFGLCKNIIEKNIIDKTTK